jgi:hypothetical protein
LLPIIITLFQRELFYFIAVKPFRNALDLSFSKKFMKDQLTLSIYADDVLNLNENAFNSKNTIVN